MSQLWFKKQKWNKKKIYYKDYKGPFIKHLHKCELNGICGTNERCWKETKENFLKKSNHNTRFKQKIFKEVGDIILKYKVEYNTQEHLMINQILQLDFNHGGFSHLDSFNCI